MRFRHFVCTRWARMKRNRIYFFGKQPVTLKEEGNNIEVCIFLYLVDFYMSLLCFPSR